MRIWGRPPFVRAGYLTALLLCAAEPLLAQALPSEPIVFGDGRVVLGGDLSLTASCAHAEDGAACANDTGFFNYSDYEHSTLRMLRAGLRTSVRIGSRLSALGEIRLENGQAPRPYGLYLRFHPFEKHDFDIQAGQIPPTFGSFARRAYSADNLLIGYPLAYQYLTSLRTDSLPATTDDLIRMRGRGWLSAFPIGNPVPAAGLPLSDGFRWDTGVQGHVSAGRVEAAASITTGSLANPLFHDNNSGKQIAARVATRPVAGLVAGVSASRAPYVTSLAAVQAGASSEDFVQGALGADVEYSRNHYLVRFETVYSTFDIATIEPRLHAMATLIEGRYKLTPRLHAAARFDHLGFSTIEGQLRTTTWDANVTRWEAGAGYSVRRNMQVRASFQRNVRDGGRVHTLSALSGQLLYWF